MCMSGNHVYSHGSRGFESLPLRQPSLLRSFGEIYGLVQESPKAAQKKLQEREDQHFTKPRRAIVKNGRKSTHPPNSGEFRNLFGALHRSCKGDSEQRQLRFIGRIDGLGATPASKLLTQSLFAALGDQLG